MRRTEPGSRYRTPTWLAMLPVLVVTGACAFRVGVEMTEKPYAEIFFPADVIERRMKLESIPAPEGFEVDGSWEMPDGTLLVEFKRR